MNTFSMCYDYRQDRADKDDNLAVVAHSSQSPNFGALVNICVAN